MSKFLDKLDNATILETIETQLLFETFLLKRSDNPYNFITISSDLDKVVDYDNHLPRFIVKTSNAKEVKKFLFIPYRRTEGKLHQTIAKLNSVENGLDIHVMGHEDYDVLKKFVTLFIAKYTDISISLTLIEPVPQYVYPELETKNLWQLFIGLFFRTVTEIKK